MWYLSPVMISICLSKKKNIYIAKQSRRTIPVCSVPFYKESNEKANLHAGVTTINGKSYS